MNSFSNSHDGTDQDKSNESSIWRFLGRWWTVATISIVLFLLTLNPLLAGAFPYFRAGWPALRTAFWLKYSDPWRARGTVGLLFHLCMACFRAGVTGLACVMGSFVIAGIFQQQPNFIQGMTAILVIFGGCIISFVFGWVGIVIALRHGVRVFVMSNLYQVCRGHFANAASANPGPIRANPARYIVAIAIAVPSLITWFTAMLITMPLNMNDKEANTTLPLVILSLLPVLGIACIILLIFLSKRIMADSPGECWEADIPEIEERNHNWYQTM